MKKNKMLDKRVLIVFFAVLLLFNGGCRSLRKKFIRKKKKEEVPVYITPKEYPRTPTREVYIDYYLYTRGWLAELVKALNKGISYKRQKYAADEAVMNLEQIISFFNQEGKESITPLYNKLKKIRAQIEQVPNLSRFKRDVIIRRVNALKRNLESDFTYSDVKEWLN